MENQKQLNTEKWRPASLDAEIAAIIGKINYYEIKISYGPVNREIYQQVVKKLEEHLWDLLD